MDETPLERVPGWSSDQVARMKHSWITTAEQLLALGATPDGLRSIAQQLNVSEREAKRLLDSARGQLSPDVLAEMETAVDTSEYGLGAIPPWEENPEP